MAVVRLLEVLHKSAKFLEEKGVESARLNAELLLAHALGTDRMRLYLDHERPLSETELDKIRPLLRRRGRREPLQYVLGQAPFHELNLLVDARVLIPRPETEQLAALMEDDGLGEVTSALDLGTGSGALALFLATRMPRGKVVGVDLSADALAVARANEERIQSNVEIHWIQSNWFANLPPQETFDLIVSNPPYLSDEELGTAEPEVRLHEPRQALVAAEEGVFALRQILENALQYLRPGGRLYLETGIAQHEKLQKLASQLGYATCDSLKDWSGRPRFLRCLLGEKLN